MPIPFSDRDPKSVARIKDSLERARQQAILSNGGANKIGGAGIEATIADVINKRKEQRTYEDFYEEIGSPEAILDFQRAIHETERFFGRADIKIPSAVDLDEADLDIEGLTEYYLDMYRKGQMPKVILAPHGLSADKWRGLYARLLSDDVVNDRAFIKGDGLYIDPLIYPHWNDLVSPPVMPYDYTILSEDNTPWTLRIISGTQRPGVQETYYGNDRTELDPRETPKHPTISEYLTLQAVNLQQGLAPIDPFFDSLDRGTWLNGVFDFKIFGGSTTMSTQGRYNRRHRYIQIDALHVDNLGSAGIRRVVG